MATTTGQGQVTVTVTADAASTATGNANGGLETASSTLSLIYIYSTSANSEPTSGASSSSSSASKHHLPGGAIAGIVVGSLALLAILALTLFCYSRRVARKRRAKMASLHQSRYMAPSRAYSPVTTIQVSGGPTLVGAGGSGDARSSSPFARSAGERSMAAAPRSLKSPDPLYSPSPPPPQELPTVHNRPELDGSRGRAAAAAAYNNYNNNNNNNNNNRERSQKSSRSRGGGAEAYGPAGQPIELQAEDMTDLVAVIQEVKRVKVRASTTDIGAHSRRGRWDTDSQDYHSVGFLGKAWPPPAAPGGGGTVSGESVDLDGTETEYGEGTTDAGSIHIYYRSSAATIAAAMSQASLTKDPRSPTIRSSSTTTRLI